MIPSTDLAKIAINYLLRSYPLQESASLLEKIIDLPEALKKDAIELEAHSGRKAVGFLYKKSRITQVFGNKIECPEFLLVDWGQFFCESCAGHSKLTAIFSDTSINIDYIYDQKLVIENKESNFWSVASHFKRKNKPIADAKESDCWEFTFDSVYDPGLVIQLPDRPSLAAIFNMIGRPWSYSTRITKNDTIELKLKRFPKSLKNRVKKVLSKIDGEAHQIQGIHFANGGYNVLIMDDVEKAPPFCIIHLGLYTCPGCHKGRVKYIVVTDHEEYGLDLLNNGDLFEVPLSVLFQGHKENNQPSIH